jgi:hypothetical protein
MLSAGDPWVLAFFPDKADFYAATRPELRMMGLEVIGDTTSIEIIFLAPRLIFFLKILYICCVYIYISSSSVPS